MKKNILFLILVYFGHFLNAQSFYDLDQIQVVKIYFGFDNWDYQLDTAKAGDESYILADSVVVNGVALNGCGVRYKGNSSYDAGFPKNPIHIKLDYTDNVDYQGFEDIKLGNGWSDNSMIREPLSYSILRQYMDAPRGNFAKVYINDTYYGLMNNAESIDNSFLLDHFYSSKYTFVKCNPLSIGGAGNGPNLAYLGSYSGDYESKYELKSDTGWSDLINLCDTLTNHPADFDAIADIDRFLWMLAFNNATVNLDSYTGTFRQNYYLYRNHANQWIPIVWDLNMCFGGFGVAGGIGGALTPVSMQTMNYELHKTETAWPLINKLLNNPSYEKMYLAHLRTINHENFAGGQYKTLANALHAMVDAEVQQDPDYLSTYSDFQHSLDTTTVGMNGAGASPGIFMLMDNRAAYLNNVLSAAPPLISDVHSVNDAIFGATATILANVANETSVYLGYRFRPSDRFIRVQMFDDGAHGDGAAGDQLYGAALPLQSLEVSYYIYAENASTGAFSPERAEHEFYSLSPDIAKASISDIVINELAANNTNGIENEAGKHKDWMEVYNKTNQTLGLDGLYLSNSTDELQKWAFPAVSLIQPHEHLLVWADDGDIRRLDLHTNFNLNNSGDLLLITDGASVGDSLGFGAQSANAALGRCPDGSGPFSPISFRTPAAENDCSSAAPEAPTNQAFLIYPNPASSQIRISCADPIEHVSIYNATGQWMINSTSPMIDISTLPPGYYIIHVNTRNAIYAKGLIKQ